MLCHNALTMRSNVQRYVWTHTHNSKSTITIYVCCKTLSVVDRTPRVEIVFCEIIFIFFSKDARSEIVALLVRSQSSLVFFKGSAGSILVHRSTSDPFRSASGRQKRNGFFIFGFIALTRSNVANILDGLQVQRHAKVTVERVHSNREIVCGEIHSVR